MTARKPERERCDHKFVDSKVCLKCGWSPERREVEKAGGTGGVRVMANRKSHTSRQPSEPREEEPTMQDAYSGSGRSQESPASAAEREFEDAVEDAADTHYVYCPYCVQRLTCHEHLAFDLVRARHRRAIEAARAETWREAVKDLREALCDEANAGKLCDHKDCCWVRRVVEMFEHRAK